MIPRRIPLLLLIALTLVACSSLFGTPTPTPTLAPTATPVPTDTPEPTATPAPTDTPPPTDTPEPAATPTATPPAESGGGVSTPLPPAVGSVIGRVVDSAGMPRLAAGVLLLNPIVANNQITVTGLDGRFVFTNVPAGDNYSLGIGALPDPQLMIAPGGDLLFSVAANQTVDFGDIVMP